MRGKAFANYVTLGRERITPAYAGKRGVVFRGAAGR